MSAMRGKARRRFFLARRPSPRARRRILIGLVLALAGVILVFRAPRASRDIEALVSDAARRHAVPRELVAAVIRAESGGDPSAISRKGAIGLDVPDGAKFTITRLRIKDLR